MSATLADSLGINSVSDLRRHPDLVLGFSIEFMDREDGWPGLSDRYALPQNEVFGLEHSLAYQGLASGSIDATDLYSTDAEIAYYNLKVLKDDLEHFPDYEAVVLYRQDLESGHSGVVAEIGKLQGRIEEPDMIALNARAKIDGVAENQIASDFLARRLGLHTEVTRRSVLGALSRNTADHLLLVVLSLGSAILVAVPLGIVAARRPRYGQAILAVAGVIQTPFPRWPYSSSRYPFLESEGRQRYSLSSFTAFCRLFGTRTPV